jgi:CheY-like chemotaxis protein
MAVVLLVEDDDQVRVLAESYLEEHGHTVLTAATSDGAFAVLRSEQPIDVLFTDIGLKEELHGGIELAQQAVMMRPDLKVLYTTERTITDGMRLQFVDGSAVLEKPYTTEQLVQLLAVNFGITPKPAA